MRPASALLAAAGLLASAAGGAEEAALRRGEAPRWKETPAVELSPTRGELVLNDLWRFQPARGPATASPAGQWGWIRVPGTWDRGSWDTTRLDSVIAPGSGGPWEGQALETPSPSFPALCARDLDRAWYEREVEIPSGWAGRRIVLDLERVSTDAKVFANGRPAGEIHWPGGELDLTGLLQPGRTNRLRLLVIAAGDAGEALQYMDAERVTRSKAVLKHRGVLGDAVLRSMPVGARIDGVFLKPSVREQTLFVDVEFAGLRAAKRATLRAAAVRVATGETEREWEMQVDLPAPDRSGNAVLRDVHLPWENPALWDFRQPNLYTLRVAIDAPGLQDTAVERFGFREFRISGRRFLLNERPYPFRLHLLGESDPVPAAIASQIDALLEANFNIAEIWPNPDLTRGAANHRPLIARLADEKGLPLLYPLGDPSGLFDPVETSVSPDRWSAWERATRTAWKRVRNSPSAVVWMLAGNRFAHADDQNPRRIGNRTALDFTPVWLRTRKEPGMRLIGALKQLDPTRPATSHHNANVGDIHTCNNYLNLHPLQEREDWLSVWAASGDMPYSTVEFDAPFAGTLTRGRKGHTGESTTEPWLTEFLAIYRGNQAYREEDPAYRAMMASSFRSGQDYQGVSITRSAAFPPFAAWWITRTLRAWRGYGLSGGMVHWADAYGWRPTPEAEQIIDLPAFVPGARGAHVPRLLARHARGAMHPSVATRTSSGDALVAGLSPTLAWIAGPPEAFTRQDHVFDSGERVVRSVALLNDTAAPLTATFTWRLERTGNPAGEPIADGTGSAEVPVGTPTFVPITFHAPAVVAPMDHLLRLRVTLGDATHEDAWPFRILPGATPVPSSGPSGPAVATIDPEGTTTRWLTALGITVRAVSPADGGAIRERVLVLGRNALPLTPLETWPALRGAIENFAERGGRVLIMGQDPEWIRAHSGLRVARHVGRRFWPVPTLADHPLLRGLDGEDFRDWRGAGTLIDPAPSMALDRPVPSVPPFGWHLHNTGSVASFALEKPHFGRWTPLLEGEFDLAFSPLLESFRGAGLVVWCGLDLDGRTEPDPSATRFSRRLLAYLDGPLPPVAPESVATFIGGPEAEALLTSMGVRFAKAETLPAPPGLAILAPGAPLPAATALDAFAKGGGRVVALGDAAEAAGFALAPKRIGGASRPPGWPETRGLSESDLRLRADFEASLIAGASGAEVAADGLLGRRTNGRGVVVAFPLTPDRLPGKDKTYFRFSQWRLTRALSQILGNLGGTFASDAAFLDFQPAPFSPVPLAGTWKIREEASWPTAASPDQPTRDPGRDARTKGWELPGVEDSDWHTVELPGEIERIVPEFDGKDGAFWFRKTFELPEGYETKSLRLRLGKIDDFDEVWLNGVRIGGTPNGTRDAWSLEREFRIRPGFLRPGTQTLVVRCFDQFGGGGFTSPSPDAMRLELANPPARSAPYVEGFRTDHELGDDYARYYRW